MSKHHHKLFVTSTDLGGSQAIVPILEPLQAQGWEVVVFAEPSSAAHAFYRSKGFEPRDFASYGYRTPDIQAMRVVLAEENPSLVLASISSESRSTDRFALDAAQRENIPCVAIVETWPEVWLARYGDRDATLYRKADRLLVPDDVSVDIARRYGFDPNRVAITGNPADDALADQRAQLANRRRIAREMFGFPPDALVIAWFGTFDLDNPAHRGESFEGKFGFSEADAYREFLLAINEARPIAEKKGRELRGLFRQKPTYGRQGLLEIHREIECRVMRDDHKDGPMIAFAASDLVCSLVGGTSIGQAAKLGIPGVFYQPGATAATDDQPSNRLGITKALYQRGELRELILRLAEDPAAYGKLKSSLRSCPVIPDATGRVIRALEACAL